MELKVGIVDVVAAVVRREDSYLLCLRPSHKRHGGRWEFPGGKVEKGESFEHALRRELAEELGLITLSVGKVLFTSQEHDSVYRIHFIEAQVNGEPVAHEHDKVIWSCIKAMLRLPLAPTDLQFALTLE